MERQLEAMEQTRKRLGWLCWLFRPMLNRAIRALRANAARMREHAHAEADYAASCFVGRLLNDLPTVLSRAADQIGLTVTAERDFERPDVVVFRLRGWQYRVPDDVYERRLAIHKEATELARQWTHPWMPAPQVSQAVKPT
jgi:DNA-directed RNA polymerase specialized sigma24 family protein